MSLAPTQPPYPRRRALLATAFLAAGALACGGDDADADGTGTTSGPLYAVGTGVYGPSGSNAYLRLVEDIALDGAQISLDEAREFPGNSDMDMYEGSALVASGDAPTITKYAVAEDGTLEAGAQISFLNYGQASAAFYYNKMVAANKAYMVNGVGQVIVWNPTEMAIEGTITLPTLEARTGLRVVSALVDRGGIVADGKFYLPMYWTDDQYAQRAPDSALVVVDIATDTVTGTIAAPCPALDYATRGDDGMLYFSNWTGGPGAYHVLGTAQNCVAVVNPTTEVVSTMSFASIAGGHEAAAFAYAGDGTFVMSVFDEVRADVANATDPFTPVAGTNWQLWRYDPADGSSSPVPGVDWNSGAVIHTTVDDTFYSMVPGADYASTVVYGHENDGTAKAAFGIDGWSFRMFRVR